MSLYTVAQPTHHIRALSIGDAITPRGLEESIVATVDTEPDGMLAWLFRAVGLGRRSMMSLTSQRLIHVTRGRTSVQAMAIPLVQLASTDYAYDRAWTKLVFGALLAMSGFVGMFSVVPAGAFTMLLGVATIVWHFASGPVFTMQFTSQSGARIALKIAAGTRSPELVEFVEKTAQQLRALAANASTPAPLPALRPQAVRAQH